MPDLILNNGMKYKITGNQDQANDDNDR